MRMVSSKNDNPDSSDKSGIASRFALFAAERGLRLLLGLFIGIAVARHLGPAAYGVLNNAMATVSIFTVIVGLGTESIVVRDFVQRSQASSQIMGAALAIRASTGLLLFFLCEGYAFLFVTKADGMRDLVIIQSILLLLSWPDVIDAWFQSNTRPTEGVLARVIAGLTAAGVRVGLILSDAGPAAFAVANLVDAATLAVALFIALQRRPDRPIRLTITFCEAQQLLKDSWPLAISSLLVMVTLQIDKILVARWCGAQEMGWYAASSRFLDVLLMLPLLMGMAAERIFAIEGRRDRRCIATQSMTTLRQVTMLCALAAAIISISAGIIIRCSFGPAFAGATPMLTIQVWAAVFITHVSLRTRMLVAEKRVLEVLLLALPTLALQIVALYFLVPWLGGIGAALSTLVSWGASVLVFPFFSHHTRVYALAFIGIFGLPYRFVK
jgi:O-antigen/teichoic acid export membrane protein